MAINSVKSHMCLLTDYDAETGILKSIVPSEPILAVAAGWLLLKKQEVYSAAMQTLVEELLLSNNIISLGKKGETLACIILIVTCDATVYAAGGQLCVVDTSSNTITEETSNQGSHLHFAVWSFTLGSFQNLVKTDHIHSDLQWAKGVHLNFTHFAQLSNFVDRSVTFDFLVMCWQRGVALQCIHNQPIIDAILIGYCGDLSMPFNPQNFVFVVLQFKNRSAAADSSLIKTMTTPFIKYGSNTWKPDYMEILMDLGTSACFKKKGGDHIQITSCRAEEGQYWSAFNEAKEVVANHINIRGYDAYCSLAQWAPAMLHFQNLKTDRTSLSTVSHRWESTLNVFQYTLGMSLMQLEAKRSKQQKV